MKLVEIVLVHKFSRPNDFTHKGINYFYLNRHSKNISRYLVKYVLDIILVCTFYVGNQKYVQSNRLFKNVYKDGMRKKEIGLQIMIQLLLYIAQYTSSITIRPIIEKIISGIVLNVIIHSILFSFHYWKIVPCHGGLSAKIVTYLPGM